jgi:two-component system phosphate regulon sensor histidine kinase PhoR
VDLVLPLALSALALVFLVLWRGEVAKRVKTEVMARREQRQAGEQLAQSESRAERLHTALDTTADKLLVIDRGLQVLYANRSAQDAFGNLMDGSSLMRYAKSLELVNLIEELERAGDEEVGERIISIREHPHRALVVLQPNRIGVALTDVAELQRLSRARQDMITNLSHELRTPITSLRLLTDTISGPAGSDPQIAQDLVGKIIAEVDHLHQMSEEMLDLSTIESGKQVMRLVPVPLLDLIADPLELLSGQTAHRGISVKVSIPDGLRVLADKDQASRAIQNVLHNAVKYTPEKGAIRVEGSQADEWGILSIADSGPGIPPDELERVFERFYRSQWAWGTPGTGLGLAIARHILEAHGGRIWAENQPLPDRGSVFHLAFRLAEG